MRPDGRLRIQNTGARIVIACIKRDTKDVWAGQKRFGALVC